MGEPELDSRQGGGEQTLIVHPENGVEPEPVLAPRVGDDAPCCFRRVVERDLDEALSHCRRQSLCPLGRDDDIDSETFGRREVFLGSVGPGRQDEEHTRHDDP